MSGPIYKMYMGRYTEAWYALPDDQRKALFDQVQGAMKQFGARSVIDCHSEWASEQWHWFGVEEYPSLEAVQQYSLRVRELQWYRYIQSTTLLGTKWQEE